MWGTRAKLCFRCATQGQTGLNSHHGGSNSKQPLPALLMSSNFSVQMPSDSGILPPAVKENKQSLLPKRNTTIPRLDPSEYENSTVGLKRLPLVVRRGEPSSFFHSLRLRKDEDTPGKQVDELAFMQSDIDLRPSAIKRIIASLKAENDIKLQAYNFQRVTVLGRDLGAAHFIVARKGRIRFMGEQNWISNYRQDAQPGYDEEDLPAMTRAVCSLPVKYDPNFRVEALDATGVPIRYEGLSNLSGLNYLKWVSFRGNPFMNDWCLDRIYSNHSETVEHLDVSSCKGISACGIAAVWRLTKLKTLVVENMSHIKDLEIICATLEDQIPGLNCIGIDYEQKLNDMKQEAAEFERRIKDEAARLEANTVEVVPRAISDGSDMSHPQDEAISHSNRGP